MTDSVYYIGAGGRNVVFGAPLALLQQLTHTTDASLAVASTGPDDPHIALRFSTSAMSECETCLRALCDFTGPHWRIALSTTNSTHTALLARAAAMAPEAHRGYLTECTEVTILPNFIAPLFHGLHETDGGRVEPLWTVELKPKATWRRPVVVGLRTASATHLLHRAKRVQCRFSLQEVYRCCRGDLDGCGDAVTQEGPLHYCPTQLYHTSQKTATALAALAATANKYFHVLPSIAQRQHCAATGSSSPAVAFPTTASADRERDALAEALDASGIWPTLEHVQLYGQAPTSTDRIPVLDIELLFPWFVEANAADGGGTDQAQVQWLYDDDAGAESCTPCRCTRGAEMMEPVLPYEISRLRAAPPSADLATCVARFYASTTAKDVSVLVTATECDARPDRSPSVPESASAAPAPPPPLTTSAYESIVAAGTVVGLSDMKRAYRIGVVDVDDKTIKSLKHYHQQDQNILAAWDSCH